MGQTIVVLLTLALVLAGCGVLQRRHNDGVDGLLMAKIVRGDYTQPRTTLAPR